jgi:beta-galactosidase GanA
MNQMRNSLLSIALLMLVATAPAFAQYQTPAQSSEKPAAALSTKMVDISNWTKKEWYAAKAKWIKEKAKWADCQMQAVERKLSGRKSWPFLYGCMTKKS